MTSIATIKPNPDSTIKAAAGETVRWSFAVTNTAGRALAVGARVLADAPADAAWFKVTGNAERELGKDDFDQVDVEAQLPADAAPGRYKFRLLVFSTAQPGEDYTESPTVSIEIPQPQEKPVEPGKPDEGGAFPWWIVAVAGVAVLLIGGGVLAWILLSNGATVPNVKGQELDDAIVILQDAGLEVPDTGVTEQATGEHPAGTVIDQVPAADAAVPDDKQVTLTIEQLTVPVPSVIGMKVPAARTALNEARLNLANKIEYARSDRFPGGAVIAQEPPAEQRAIPGQEVSVTVAEQLIRVPSLRGKSYTDARIALETLGLTAGKVSYEKTGGAPDTVLRQRPDADTEIEAAGKVDLWLVEKRIPVPNVKGKDLDAAKTALSRAGLKPVLFPIAPPPKSDAPTGKVHEQRPSANAQVYTGTEVTLVYYNKPRRVIGIVQPMKIQPQIMTHILTQTRELKQVDGDLRTVAPAAE